MFLPFEAPKLIRIIGIGCHTSLQPGSCAMLPLATILMRGKCGVRGCNVVLCPDQLHCWNCNGSHPAGDKKCHVHADESGIQEFRDKEGLSFSFLVARKRFIESKTTLSRTIHRFPVTLLRSMQVVKQQPPHHLSLCPPHRSTAQIRDVPISATLDEKTHVSRQYTLSIPPP
jgi:hypothetical protein